MTYTVRFFLALALMAFIGTAAWPEETENNRDKVDLFLDQQAEATLQVVQDVLSSLPPQGPEPLDRRMALLMLDGVFHEVNAPKRPPVQSFHHARIQRALEEIEKSRVDKGAILWKLYNHAFIVRTPAATLAFDLTRGHSVGNEGFALSDDVAQALVRQCDVLFVSHAHPDHADDGVAEDFLNENKPVLCPPGLWGDREFSKKLIRPRGEAPSPLSVPLSNGRSITVTAYPGHQGPLVPNNVYLVVTADPISFCHTGDQSEDADFSWIDELGKNQRVDVLMPNCWTTDILRMVRGIAPQLIITGHENELGHTIDHREPYWLTYSRLQDSPSPQVLMTWGESFHYIPAQP